MSGLFTHRRWSTLTLFSVGVAFCLLGYLAGSQSSTPASAVNKKPTATLSADSRANPRAATDSLQPEIIVLAPADPWRQFSAAPHTSLLEKKRLVALEEIAATDHRRAFALAATETNWRRRTLLCNAALRGWASTDPNAAAQFALTLPEAERREAVTALFSGASNNPTIAATLAAAICAQDPALAEDHGRALIDTLAEVGAYSVLTQFAANDTSGHSADWLHVAFGKWAEREPAAALQALDSLPTPTARQAAFQGLVLGWSMADPHELATYAVSLPAGENRSLAMQQALTQWMTHDPDAATQWVMRFDPGTEFDLSAATVATSPKLIAQQPAIALGWAQSILEPALRESTLTTLAHEWAGQNRAAAQRLITETVGLSPEDRNTLFAGLNSTAPSNR